MMRAPMFERDYFLRQIKQLGDALRRIAGMRKQAQIVEAKDEIAKAYKALAIDRSLLEFADAASVARMVGSKELLDEIVRMMRMEADVLEDAGDTASAARKRIRADILDQAQ